MVLDVVSDSAVVGTAPTQTEGPMEVRALGTLQVAGNAHLLGPEALGGRKPKQVLAVLVAARGHAVVKERLVDALWGEQVPRHPTATLENHVWVLRRHLRPVAGDDWPVVDAVPGGYRLVVEHIDLDLDRFDALVRRADGSTARVDRRELEQALALVRGELLEDELYAPWLEPLRRTYDRRVRDARLRCGELALDLGDATAALAHAQLVLEVDALNERACRLELRALDHVGERAAALRAYTSFRERVRRELGVDPSPETSAVHDAVQRGERASGGRRVTALARPVGPGPGVGTTRSERATSGQALVGRASELRAVRAAVERAGDGGPGLVLLGGLADVGKTHLVRMALAGLSGVPTGWVTLDRATRHYPALALAAALRHAGGGGVATRASTEPEALEALAAALARHAPVVLVVDDLHEDVSGEVVEALGFLQLRCADAPIRLVGVYRRELVGYGHPLTEVHAAARVHVEPLTTTQLRPLGGEPVAARTGGYGAYVGAWLRGDRRGPPSDELRRRVLARCRTVGKQAHRLLRTASVLSEPIAPATLAHVSGMELNAVAEELDHLVAYGLLREHGAPGYGFAGTVVRDTVATEVSPARRRVIHAAVVTRASASPPVA